MTSIDSNNRPRGELLLKTLAMPKDTNPAGDIFGGWILSEMDIAGGILCKQRSHGRVVTVAVDAMKFIRPVHVGDTVCCYGDVLSQGTTSISVWLEVWVTQSYAANLQTEPLKKVTEANFTFVSVDENGNKRSLPS